MSENVLIPGRSVFPSGTTPNFADVQYRLKPNPTLTARWAYTAEACREALTDAPSSIVAVRIRAL